MKTNCLLTFFIFYCSLLYAQIDYESPFGFTLNFDKTWKRLPREILEQRMSDVKDYLNYKKEIRFDACYQKIGNANMDYPYILFKNIPATTKNQDEIKLIQNNFLKNSNFNSNISNIVKGKFSVDIKMGTNYYDAQNNILIYTYDMGISIKGNLVGIFAFYIGKNASIAIYCYSYKDEFKYDKKEFLDIIYSIKDKGMKTELSGFVNKHDIAANYYNEGKLKSASGNRKEAISMYTKAIENYPIEDSYSKSEAYYNRGLNKRYLNDLKGAIVDYTEAIKLRPDYYKAYNNRGYAKIILEDFSGAIADFTMTIKYDNYNTEFTNIAIGNRGIAKIKSGQNGCADIKKAIELGNTKLYDIFNENCK